MNTYVKLIVAAVAMLVVAVACSQLVPGGGGGEPTIASPPSATLLASGSFKAKGEPVELDATGSGDDVTGSMTVGDPDEPLFAVDLTCARIAEDGRILIAGDTTESNARWATTDDFTAIVIKPGSPGHAVFAFGSDAASAASCTEFLEAIIDRQFTTAIGDGALEPIEGTVALRP